MANIPSGSDAAIANFQRLMTECELKKVDLARRIDAHPVTVSAWSTGKARIPGSVIAYLDLLSKVKALAP